MVLSGAYAVLSGAPALVAAVDRYVLADSARPSAFDAPEVRAALGPTAAAPWFDPSALRENGQKLGLGSSAAIVVASLAALELDREPGLSDAELCARVYEPALRAHRAAQGGGSGVDVASSAHGGLIAARRTDSGVLAVERSELPKGLVFEVWAHSLAASTAEFLAQIRALAARDPALHAARIAAQANAAEATLSAVRSHDAPSFIAGIARQLAALSALGEASSIAIVTPEHAELGRLALANGAAFLPAGAGGGDVAYYVGLTPPAAEFGARARSLGLTRLDLALGARGVHGV